MVKNIKLIAVVFLVIVSFFILLKGLNKTNIYSPNLNSSKIDFNFKAKFLYSDEETTLYSDNFLVFNILKNDGFYNVRYQIKPFMIWIWISIILISFGGILSIVKKNG